MFSWFDYDVIVNGKKLNKIIIIAIIVALSITITIVAKTQILPMYKVRINANNICDEIAKAEPYATLKKLYPEDYKIVRHASFGALLENKTQQVAYLRGRAELLTIVKNEMIYASDEAITGFAKSFVDIASYYYNNNSKLLAYDVFYNQKELPANWYTDLPNELTVLEQNSYKYILLSAADKKDRVVDMTRIKSLMAHISSKMYAKYGTRFEQIMNPLAYPDNKDEICKITLDFYNVILELPVSDRGMIIRQLFAKKDRQKYKVLHDRPTIIN